mmetsp:Transcript_7145/g.12430  ORF Transcript_7145/g.12430 Transcript_7145/m.12430 type:complete len:315 (-) Transcript_7145:54-998(-)
MTSPRPPKDPKDKWWNEEPLEGPWYRPAVLITKVLSKSPLLIGWDDESIERRAREARRKAGFDDDDQPAEIHMGPKKEVVNKVAFGLLGIAAKEVTMHLLNLEVQNEAERMKGPDLLDVEEIAEIEKIGDADIKQELEQELEQEQEGNLFVDTSSMKETELYQLALRNLRWQRDNYLVGKDYADSPKLQELRRRERLRKWPTSSPYAGKYPSFSLPYDPGALGNQQLLSLCSWFIPSPTVHNIYVPLVIKFTGSLNERILWATTDLIRLSQGNLDSVVMKSLLWFLRDEEKKKFIKNSTRGYILQAYRNNSEHK